MALDLPQRGDTNWDTPLNYALNQLESEIRAIGPQVSYVAVPATPTSTGSVGQFAVNSTHIYFCVAANTWVRALRNSWS
jgi:hypothetical protein